VLLSLTLLVALCGASGVAALRWTVGGADPRTVLVLQAKQFLGDLVVDAPAGHVYATLYDPSGPEIRVLDGARTARGYRFGATTDGFGPLSVEPGTGRLYAVQPSPDRQSTRVNLLDARQGTRLATAIVPLSPNYPGGVAVGGGVVVLGGGGDQHCIGPWPRTCAAAGGGVAILDAASDRLRHVLHVPDGAWAVGVDTRAHHVIVAGATGNGAPIVIRVFDAASGRLVRRTTFNAPNLMPQRMVVDGATGRAFIAAGSLYGRPFPGAPPGGAVLVLDTRTGMPVRTITLGSPATDIAMDHTTGRVFVTDRGPTRYVQTAFPNGASMGMSMAIGAGLLHTLNARTGVTISTAPLGIGPGSIAVDERRGRVYVTHTGSHDGGGSSNGVPIVIAAPVTGPGGVSVVDARTGRVLRTLALGVAPGPIVLDDRTRQVFIGDGGDFMPRPPADAWAWVPAQVRRRFSFIPQQAPTARPRPGRVLALDVSHL